VRWAKVAAALFGEKNDAVSALLRQGEHARIVTLDLSAGLGF